MSSNAIGGRRTAIFALLACLGAVSVADGVSALADGAGAPRSAAAPSPDLQQLAASYVDEYQKQLTAVVADELYTQTIRGQDPGEEGAPWSRTTRGEMFFLFATAERQWMAIR